MTRRVLIVRLDSLGDVLVCSPAVRAVAARADSEVWLLCGPQGAPAGRLLPGVARVLTWWCPWIAEPGRPVDGDLVDELAALIAECDPQEVIILTSFHQSPLPLALLLRLQSTARLIGASTDSAGALLDVRLIPGEDFDEDIPEPLRALAIARAAGYDLPPTDDGRLRVDLPDTPALPEIDAPYVVVHPGAAVPARAWPAQLHARAVRELVDGGRSVVVTGGPGERQLTALVAGTVALDLGGRTDLGTTARILADADAVICGNTGVAHLAAAVGTPVVSLFAPVVPAVRWAPYGIDVELLGDQSAACAGTRARTCPVPGHPCLAHVRPEDVVAACDRLIERSRVGAAR